MGRRTLLLGVGLLIPLLLAMSFADRLIYCPVRPYDGTPESIGLAYEDVRLTASDGVRVHGWFVPGEDGAPPEVGGEGKRAPRPVVLLLHGNAGNISHRLDKLAILHGLGADVPLLDYRGYGESEGTPSEDGLYRDADAAYDWLVARGFAAGDVVVYRRRRAPPLPDASRRHVPQRSLRRAGADRPGERADPVPAQHRRRDRAVRDGRGDARRGARSEDRNVVAVEPSRTMIRQRSRAAAPTIQATAAELPFRDASFDAAQAILTVHHWRDRARAFDELGRAARERVVLLTWDPEAAGFWLTDDYFPEIPTADRRIFPTMSDLARAFGGEVRVERLLIPHDCTDGFLAAYWRRPAAYLDAGVRSAISCFAKVGDVSEGLARLASDLHSGEWRRRYGHLLGVPAMDFGYRLVTARLH